MVFVAIYEFFTNKNKTAEYKKSPVAGAVFATCGPFSEVFPPPGQSRKPCGCG